MENENKSIKRPGGYSHKVLDAKKENKRNLAMENKEKYQKLTIIQRIGLLDSRLGKGQGAVRERLRLQKQLATSVPVINKPVAPVTVAPVKDVKKPKNVKRYSNI